MSHFFDFFSYQDGHLSSEGLRLSQVVKEMGTPLYVYSEKALLSNLIRLQTGLDGLNHLICFAMKSNSNISILKLLASSGAGIDTVSGGELYRCQLAGVSGDKIVFSGVGKTKDEMKMGLNFGKNGIYSFNIESVPELSLLNQVALELGKKAPIALRFNPDVNPKTHPYIATGIKSNKFGMNRKEILKIVRSLRDLKGIELKGISIHIGSQLLSLSPLEAAFKRLSILVDEISPILNKPLEFVDLGGGLGITYKNEKHPSIPEYCKLIHRVFGIKSKHRGTLKIILEPGRQLSGNSGILLTKILYRKKRPTQDFLIVDAAMNDLIRPALYESHHEIIPLDKRLQKAKLRKTHVVGPVCESSDFFGKNRLLSQSLESEDLIAILSAGAYGFSMSSQYNSRPRPAEVLITDGNYRVIRRRESYSDLVIGEQQFS